MSTETTYHKNIRITGRVQGVGFRYSARSLASSLGIKGFVRNLPNGEVYIEAEGNYLTLHTANSKNLYRDTITNISEKLNPELFVRIHRSYIVKIENIKEMQSHFNSEYIIILKDNTKLKSGRSYKAEVEKLLKH
jgi:two-component system LytT family response regulator